MDLIISVIYCWVLNNKIDIETAYQIKTVVFRLPFLSHRIGQMPTDGDGRYALMHYGWAASMHHRMQKAHKNGKWVNNGCAHYVHVAPHRVRAHVKTEMNANRANTQMNLRLIWFVEKKRTRRATCVVRSSIWQYNFGTFGISAFWKNRNGAHRKKRMFDEWSFSIWRRRQWELKNCFGAFGVLPLPLP